jgi:hypothetical protein
MPRAGGDDESRRRYVAQRSAFALLRCERRLSFPTTLDNALAHLMIYGFIMLIGIAPSIRNLPLFMRLATSPKPSPFPVFVLYVSGVTCRIGTVIELGHGQ